MDHSDTSVTFVLVLSAFATGAEGLDLAVMDGDAQDARAPWLSSSTIHVRRVPSGHGNGPGLVNPNGPWSLQNWHLRGVSDPDPHPVGTHGEDEAANGANEEPGVERGSGGFP